MTESRGTLRPGEPHPAAEYARDYILTKVEKLPIYMESFASVALSGNRLAEICVETLDRIQRGEPVSDRYFMGLAWTIWRMEEGADNGQREAIPPVEQLRKVLNQTKGDKVF